jgi:N-acetylglutamate synthase-like GNAT family acetyltransferase
LGLPRDIRQTFSLKGEEFELFVQENGQLVGGLVTVWIGNTEIELRHLAVAAHAQGRGLGRDLVTELYRIAKTRYCQRIHATVRNTSAGFFRSLGFQSASGQAPEHPVFLEHGIRFELMERLIEQDSPAN